MIGRKRRTEGQVISGRGWVLPYQLGPYTLVRKLAEGGMAEVFAARVNGVSGFEKLVAVKVIHPKYSEDEEFVRMLVDEAKLTVKLNHANIAHVFDLACSDDIYFIVLEYVEGVDLFRLLRSCAQVGQFIPFDVVAYIVAEACTGLEYAHTLTDENGKALGIIHRDISPQNILVTLDGQVKVVDFGIAKAASRNTQTEAGVIKGKYYYMSPEQAWGDELDHRSDLFSAGIVLYEMLTGRMLYQEQSFAKLLQQVRLAEIASPRLLRAEIPPELAQIAMQALDRDPEKRFQSGGELSTALQRFLRQNSPGFTLHAVKVFLDQLLATRGKRSDVAARVDELRSLRAIPSQVVADVSARAVRSVIDDAEQRASTLRGDRPSVQRVLSHASLTSMQVAVESERLSRSANEALPADWDDAPTAVTDEERAARRGARPLKVPNSQGNTRDTPREGLHVRPPISNVEQRLAAAARAHAAKQVHVADMASDSASGRRWLARMSPARRIWFVVGALALALVAVTLALRS